MDKIAEESLVKAGRIGATVLGELKRMAKPGVKLVELADFAEKRIAELGGKPAFPLNTSLNDIAAHYVAMHNDTAEVKAGDLLKLDIGVRVGGYISDSAITYCSEKGDLAEAAGKVLDAGIAAIRPGAPVGDVSAAIQAKAEELGFGVIVNLTGHGIGEGQFHAAPIIPNTRTGNKRPLEEGEVIALEPFLAQGNGYVKDSAPVEIFRYLRDKPVRLPEARKLLTIIREEYEGYPFAKRWLMKSFSPVKASMALKELESVGAIESYPPLKETKGQLVAQAEHTIIVKGKPVVTTKLVD